MCIEYIQDDKRYLLHYTQLRSEYQRFCQMADNEFIANLKEALHLACVICFFKEIKTEHCLNDIGIIHEMVHLLSIEKDTLPRLHEIRDLFEEQLKLA